MSAWCADAGQHFLTITVTVWIVPSPPPGGVAMIWTTPVPFLLAVTVHVVEPGAPTMPSGLDGAVYTPSDTVKVPFFPTARAVHW